MALIIEQRFPLGRFHATRWNQGAFGDAYGEWPPSPWRLLRALAMRWFQYARETGDAETAIRDSLLQSLAGSMPAFSLQSSTWRGPALKQYQPTNIDWTDKSKAAAGYKKSQTTLVEDHYRAVPPDEPLFWCWEQIDHLPPPQEQLLDCLLERTLYFGRAESFSRLRRVAALPASARINCWLERRDTGMMTPVLVHLPERPLDLAVLLAATDDKELKGRSIPPGTSWYYAKVPRQPAPAHSNTDRMKYPDRDCIQFAVGGRVFPPLRYWVKLTNRFRGRVIRHLTEIIAPVSQGRYDLLTAEQKDKLALICGKDGQGQPLRGHRHAFFLLWPDEDGWPTRLIVWRGSPFTPDEVKSLLSASEYPVAWDNSLREWKVRLVPLPYETPVPGGLLSEARVWESVTPFVPPSERHRFRKNGRERLGESIERLVMKLLLDENKPTPEKVIVFKASQDAQWVNLHETRNRRLLKADSHTPWVRPGFRVRVEFPAPVAGPVILGDSCHFGLGLFAPNQQEDKNI